MRRTTLVVILIALAIGASLFVRATGRRPVIGFAYARTGAAYLDLARSALAERGVAIPEFVHDSVSPQETSDGALAQAAAFVDRNDVAVVVGPSNSRHALATAPAYNAAGLSHIVPSATSRRLRDAGGATFTLVPDDSVEGDFLARFGRHTLQARRAVVFYVNDEYGEGLRAGIVATFGAIGGVMEEAIPIGEEMDVATLMASVMRRHRPDVIFSAARSYETGRLLGAARQYAPGVPVVAGDGAYLPAQPERFAGGDLSGLYVLSFWVYDSTDASHRAFADRVRRILGTEPTPEDALTEDALGLATALRSTA
ncbi:MAG: ABC transporter substrate-binding protein [Gemmatimonadota bacterium]